MLCEIYPLRGMQKKLFLLYLCASNKHDKKDNKFYFTDKMLKLKKSFVIKIKSFTFAFAS